MNERPFKTYNQQLKILRKKGLVIKDGAKAKRILERENYYCISNGYKEPFLIDSSTNDDVYKKGCSFDEVYQLFCLDRELKNLFLPEIIKFESFMKSQIAYYFHESHPDKNSFLVFENYSSDPQKAKNILDVIASLSTKISKQKNNAVTYYIQKYQHCPLWVLVNFLTFGNISKLYRVCDRTVRLNIAKEFSKHYTLQYNVKIQISPEMLDECLGCMSIYRNLCAHDERLYNYKGRFKERALSSALQTKLLSQKNLFSVLILLKLFSRKKDYRKFLRNYQSIFTKYQDKFNTIDIDDIKVIAGYDEDWINGHIK